MALHRLEHVKTRLKELEVHQHSLSTPEPAMLNRTGPDPHLARSTSQTDPYNITTGQMRPMPVRTMPYSQMDQR